MSMFIVMAEWDLDLTKGMNEENNGEMQVDALEQFYSLWEDMLCIFNEFEAFWHNFFQGYNSGGDFYFIFFIFCVFTELYNAI